MASVNGAAPTEFRSIDRARHTIRTAPRATGGSTGLTRAAIFLVATINPGGANRAMVRSFCGDLPALLRAVGFGDIEGNLSCVMGIGSDVWDRLFGQPRPAELHPFREIKAGSRHAVATRFELATQIMAQLDEAVSPVDEVHGFRYFDDREAAVGACDR